MSVTTDLESPSSTGWKEKGPWTMPRWEVEEDIVISGMSGRFPEADNVEELKKNLYEKVDMITENDRRYPPGLFGTPRRSGKLKDISNFDSMFFAVHGKLADVMDPQQRMFLEVTYEAIFDSGVEPSTLRGRNIGVFIGCSERCTSELIKTDHNLNGYELIGLNLGMMANRISFTFDFRGPSFTLDTACSASFHALNEAILALRTNRCEAAVVGGSTVSLNAVAACSFAKLGLTSMDGECRVFDASANGYVRSEGVSIIFLQRASQARRCYATIMHCKLNNDGSKPEGISFPGAHVQAQLYKEVYSELNFDPTTIDFLEAHGTGTVAGDREESNAIADFFCTNRSTPLLVGSVKSNMGHAEAVSGMGSIAKVVLAMETDQIAPNLHYKEPNPEVPALMEGRMQVIHEVTPWKAGVVAINNFGFGGSNAHLVLKCNQVEKKEVSKRTIPRLALVCGRSESAVKKIFKKIDDERYSDEAILLLEEACKAPTSGMRYRGYGLIKGTDEETSIVVERAPSDSRPVWFLFSGMGSQWTGMAKDMMQLDIFAQSIHQSAEVLKPYGVDLIHLLTEATEEELNHIIAPFVTIASIQIALMQVVRALGIEPDGIVGHSVGELGCAYADGCFTEEQMLLAAYWRGRSCQLMDLTKGAMAAVGLTCEAAQERCPEGVFAVCHNAEDSVTISGPAEVVKEFVEQLTRENIFARMVKTCDLAFHSRYVQPAAEVMRRELAKVIPSPLPRSPRWISSSVPESEWDKEENQLSSVEYHVNNLLSPVLFHEAMAKVPQDAIVIEFAPHALLQAIVKRTLGPNAIYLSLMNKGHIENLLHCLAAVGRMYLSNLAPCAKNLYEPISFPVSRGTPMLSSLIQWEHPHPWSVNDFTFSHKSRDFYIAETTKGCPDEFLLGHKVDGRILFPAMGYITLVWKVFANKFLVNPQDVAIVIEDINMQRAVLLPKNGVFRLCVKILESNGEFQVLEGDSLVVSGRVKLSQEEVLRTRPEDLEPDFSELRKDSFTLNAEDFYKELRLRGYEYGPTFKCVEEAETSGLRGRIKWEGRWETFMDAMLQIPIMLIPKRALLLPTRIKSVRIDPRKIPESSDEGIPFFMNPYLNVSCCGPVEIQGLHCGIAPRRLNPLNDPVLEEYVFVPHFDSCILTGEEKRKVEEYSHVCSTVARKVLQKSGKQMAEISAYLNGFRDAPDELMTKYLASEEKNHAVLRALQEILEADVDNGFQENVKSVLSKYRADIFNDLLCTLSIKENSLRAALDIFQDNISSKKIKILEVSANSVLHKNVTKMLGMSTLGMVHFDYSIARLTSEVIPEGIVESSVHTFHCDFQDTPLTEENDLVVAKDLFTDSGRPLGETLKFLVAATKERGFVFLTERIHLTPAERVISVLGDKCRQELNEQHLDDAFQKASLEIIAKKKDQFTSVSYLLRKIEESNDAVVFPSVIYVPESGEHTWVEALREKLKEFESKPEDNSKVWLVANEPNSGILGLINCLRQEPGGKHLRCFFNASLTPNSEGPKFHVSNPVIRRLVKTDLTINIYRNRQWGKMAHRLLNQDPPLMHRQYAFLNVTHRGDLSSIKWIESPLKHSGLVPEEIPKELVHVYYAPINFRDIMLASGRLPADAIPGEVALQECIMGLEFSGRLSNGNRVFGVMDSQGMATAVAAFPQCIFQVPDNWTLEQASTVPVVYTTAYYALMNRGRMQKGESILIHSGSGGVGQAAITIALSMNCQVFVTVGSEEKKIFLKELFPQLQEKNFSNSRSVRFLDDILNATKGEGVDLVLNSLAEDKLQASVRCLKKHGRFLEIGKFDLAMDNKLGMAAFLKNITFHGILLDALFAQTSETESILKECTDMLKDGIIRGVVRPLKSNVYNWDQSEDAFRFMASGKHMGKVILKIRDEEPVCLTKPAPVEIPCITRTYCHPLRSYIITGGLGGFGFELANWLVSRGAKHILLSSRTGIRNGYQRLWLQRWARQGVEVRVSHQDITIEEGAKRLIGEAFEMAPVEGVFHLAMVLHDSLFENLTEDDFEKVWKPKVKGVRQLDLQSRKMCPDLQYFVVFSSIACGRGNPGQSNYGFANSAMERVVEQRKSLGLPGLAVQWGGIGDVGVVYEYMGGNDVLLKGSVPQRLNSCLSTLDRLMQEGLQIVSSFVPAEKAAFGMSSDKDLLAQLCNVLGIKDPSTLKPDMTLGELGMDSLMGVEIKQVLETDYDTVLSMPEVRQLSIKDLKAISAKKKGGRSNEYESENMTPVLIGEIYIPTEILVPLNDIQGSHCLFLVHPIEGHVNMMRDLGSRLLTPTYGFQFTDDVPSESIQDIASCYVQHLKTVQSHGPYHIGGYSYGTLIALEMVVLLQKTDKVKTFLCLDGAPASIAAAAEGWLKQDDGRWVSGVPFEMVVKTYWRNVPKPMLDFFKTTIKTIPFEKAVDYMVEGLGKEVNRNIITKILNSGTRLSIATHNYKPSGIFRGNATLVKSSYGEHLKEIQISHLKDYGLKQSVDGSVEILEIKCRHLQLIKEKVDAVAKIFNSRIQE